MVKIIDGAALALKRRNEIKTKIEALLAQGRRSPCLSVILVGDDPASQVYVGTKEKACREVGIESRCYRINKSSPQADILTTLQKLNEDSSVDGILVQLPLPEEFDSQKIIAAIDPKKDVDGLGPLNQGLLALGQEGFVPCTPLGVMDLLQEAGVDLRGKRAAVIGRSRLVGVPMQRLLLAKDATTIAIHSKTKNPQELTRLCDVLVVAAGKAGLIDEHWVKPGAIVIDVGIHRSNGKLVGDVAFDRVKDAVSMITPVPGGVGPMTVACLLQNCLQAYGGLQEV